jgi:hypothetical protein
VGWGGEVLKLFRDAGFVQLAAFIMSTASLWVAILAWRSTHRTNHRLVEIEERRDRLATMQAVKASLTASFYEDDANTYLLTIRNDGDGAAKNIHIWLDGRPASEQPAGQDVQSENDRLSPQGALKFSFCGDYESPLPKTIRIEWDDDSGENGLYESDL